MRNRMMDREALGFERHGELLAEAQRRHRVARALREAREEWEARQARVAVREARNSKGAAGRAVTPPPRVGAGGALGRPRSARPNGSPQARAGWRRAAGMMGASLVTLGKRLERLGTPSRDGGSD